jgi:Ni/Co efflux regulator RcnB
MMRTTVMLGAGLALTVAGVAGAQTPGASYPAPGSAPGRVVVHGPGVHHPAMPPAPRVHQRGSRWGSQVGGRWWGGANAPGGWAAYRAPFRGYRVPTYWAAPRFYITDWQRYRLPAPTGGYSWARYYDDAVLIDRGGSVYDHRSGLDWDGGFGERRETGVGGAVAGAVLGGVAGNVIAGRGSRLEGTLIGAGVGAAAGFAIDKAEDRGRRGYDGDYREPPMAPDRAPPPPHMRERRIIIERRGEHGRDIDGHHDGGYAMGHHDGGPYASSADGRTTVVTSGGHGGGYGGSYTHRGGGPVIVHAPYGGVTTVTVHSAPTVTTTTTTETFEDVVTYTRPIVTKRKVHGKRLWRTKTKTRARCAC